tara:strand:+ start:1248 stop:1661 length:414 start_codon:yes stop_codon:yes gene_type:complete
MAWVNNEILEADLIELLRLAKIGGLEHGDGQVALQEVVGIYLEGLENNNQALAIFNEYVEQNPNPNINPLELNLVRQEIIGAQQFIIAMKKNTRKNQKNKSKKVKSKKVKSKKVKKGRKKTKKTKKSRKSNKKRSKK